MIYCATQQAGAFAETMARFRPQPRVLAGFDAVLGQEGATDGLRPRVDPEDPPRGIVPRRWLATRQLCPTTLDPSLQFIDATAGETIHHLRLALAPMAAGLDLPDFDLSSVTGPQRRLTQACARYVYDQTDESGQPLYAGIRYVSRLNPAWECWAIFHDRMRHTPVFPETIFPDDPGLLEAAALLGLTIEGIEGQYLRPWR